MKTLLVVQNAFVQSGEWNIGSRSGPPASVRISLPNGGYLSTPISAEAAEQLGLDPCRPIRVTLEVEETPRSRVLDLARKIGHQVRCGEVDPATMGAFEKAVADLTRP